MLDDNAHITSCFVPNVNELGLSELAQNVPNTTWSSLLPTVSMRQIALHIPRPRLPHVFGASSGDTAVRDREAYYSECDASGRSPSRG